MKPMAQVSLKSIGMRRFLSLLLVGVWFASSSALSPAAEPHEKFLQRLRDNNYFDLALLYLDDVQKSRGLDPKFASVIELEKGLLHFQSASMFAPKTPQRTEKLNETEKLLRKFVVDSKQHPRRGEARLKLGTLLRMRAEESLAVAGDNREQGVPEAINFFDSAHKLFEETIVELAEVENTMKGARVDPKDTEKVAYRNQVRLDLREAQLLSAKAIEDRGKSRGTNDPARKADLEKSLDMYSELYRKESLAGIKSFALLYRSGVQAALGKNEDAIDGYQRIVDMENVDQLRPLQMTALTELIQVLASEEKFQPASERTEAWLAKLRPDEKDSAEVMALRLAYSKVRIAWSKKLAGSDEKLAGRIDKAVRSDLRTLIRIPGPHIEEAKEVLASLGVDLQPKASTAELPKVKNLTEAIDECRKMIDDSDNDALAITVLEEQLKDPNTSEDQKSTLSGQRESQQQQVDQVRRNAVELLRIGLQKYDGKKDDRTQLFNARISLAYLLLKLKDTREAIVVGEFLSRTSPGTSQGLNASAIVLEGFANLLKRENVDYPGLIAELGPFAEFLVANWPQSREAAAASGALAQLAVESKDWDMAEKYLQLLPTTTEGVGSYYFDLARGLFNEYQKLVRDKSADENTVSAARTRAAKWMSMTVEHTTIDDSSAGYALAAANAMAQINLSQNKFDEASKLMFDGDKAPMKWLESKLDKVLPESAMETYRTAMQITAANVVEGKVEAKVAAEQMQGYIAKLQELGAKSKDGPQKLQQIFTNIASDLKNKFAMVKQPEKRADLSSVMLLVVDEAAKSDSYSTQEWAASTLVSMAEELEARSGPAALQLFQRAQRLLEQMVAHVNKNPSWAPPDSMQTLQIKLARASEGTNDLPGALKAYTEILDKNSSYIDIQIGAARTLQKLAANNPKLYKSAISGGRPNAKKENILWGWGKIAQEASKRIADFQEQFYEARYQLANCRMLYAISLTDEKAKPKDLAGAERVINDTIVLYPGLGGEADVKRYDALMKQIQKALGKPETGLKK
jgi:hypothetical protein